MEATELERKLSEFDCPFEIRVIRSGEGGRMEGRARITQEIRPGIERTAWLEMEDPGIQHWGCWHPERGWMSNHAGELFVTTNKAVAQAQCDVTRRWTSDYFDASLYEVRCIEEWADEQPG